ncbi:hypothetical protein EON64_03780 [archaeon]|nr:MAG: hypothetical protein EON64_03780 [archaeon]
MDTIYVLFACVQGRCIVCGAPGISDAYYCRECTLQEKDVSMCGLCIQYVYGTFIHDDLDFLFRNDSLFLLCALY